jgi:hypothetical protein
MDNKAQMYVYEAIAVVLIMIASVYFSNFLISPPVAPDIDITYQLESYGNDALRILDQKGEGQSSMLLGSSQDICSELNGILPPEVSYRLEIDRQGRPDISGGEAVVKGRITTSAYYIVVDGAGNVDHVQLYLWYG